MADEKNESGKAIEGIFSTQTDKLGGKQYWLVKEIPGGRAEAQPVNERLIPQGAKKIITLGELLEAYEPEPDFYVGKTYKERKLSEGEARTAADQEKVPIDLEGLDLHGTPEEVEKNARAGFGIGLSYLKRGYGLKAKHIFESLADADADYAPEHKHMLNDFGVLLRKQRLSEASIKHYNRALSMTRDDGNLFFNAARAHYELGDYDKACECLEEALKVDPLLMEARMFIEYIRRKRQEAASRVRLDFDGI